jgi:hypothetical protein
MRVLLSVAQPRVAQTFPDGHDVGAVMSMETETATWFCGFKSRVRELSAGILRLSLRDRFRVDRRLSVQVRSRQYNANRISRNPQPNSNSAECNNAKLGKMSLGSAMNRQRSGLSSKMEIATWLFEQVAHERCYFSAFDTNQ